LVRIFTRDFYCSTTVKGGIMSSRGLRIRSSTVNYNVKDMETEGGVPPAWLKHQKSATSSGNASDKSSNHGSAEKENGKQMTTKPAKPVPQPKVVAKEASKPKEKEKKKVEGAVAARGRNAGLKMLPIGAQMFAMTLAGWPLPRPSLAPCTLALSLNNVFMPDFFTTPQSTRRRRPRWPACAA
jgi:hypothetical protein